MRIIIPIKQILDPSGILVRRDIQRVFVNREEYIIDPASKAALEAALCIKDVASAELIAISMGLPQAEDALREALAMGCDAAYLLSDPAFRDADIVATVRVLSVAIEKLGGADLVITGCASGDDGAGQIGPRLAEALHIPQVTDVCELESKVDTIRVTRCWGNRYVSILVPLPAVVTVLPDTFPPRYAHGARIMDAYRTMEVPVWGKAELGLEETDLAPLLVFRGESFPPPLPKAERYQGDPANLAHEVITLLKREKVIGKPGGSHGL